jgi:small GTP-binding protein
MTEYKIALVGDGGVGKTSLVSRIKTNSWTSAYVATLGTTVSPYTRNNIQYNVWDTAGCVEIPYRVLQFSHRDSIANLVSTVVAICFPAL